MSLSAGERLGPYEILSPLGAGGMGEVWKARDTRLDRTVAIKRLKGQHSARFEREARAIAALNHPHICQIYDVGASPSGFGYLVMEYIDGAPLRGPQPAGEAVRLAIQIASALEEAHARGIIHRDLKPANILVAGSRAKLLDFGLAKTTAVTDETRTIEGTILGTPAYMAPEQVEGKPLDVRSDVFSFGAVLYELLSGRRAFDGLASVLRDEPTRLDSPVAEIVTRCLAKQASQRFESMTDVRLALESLAAKPNAQPPSIAVLPFANMSRDADDEYFSDGLAEEILNVLAHIPGLKVIARTSSFAFRGKEQDITKIAEALRVRTILEGSVRRSGSRIRVTAQLIDAADGSHLWSERYDREMTDVFAVQDEIAEAIAGALRVRLVGKAAETRQHQPNLPAYEALLRGRHQMAMPSPAAFTRARAFFDEAMALDPGYAEPHAELGSYYFILAVWGLRPPTEAMPLARAEALKALELSPSESWAHLILCSVAASYDYDWAEAERQYRLALSAAFVPPQVRSRAALQYLLSLGRFEEAVREIEAALEQDPLNLSIRLSLAIGLLYAGRYDRAVDEAGKILEFEQQHWGAFMIIGQSYALRGKFAEARGPTERAFQLAPWNPLVTGALAGVLACLGEQDRADRLMAQVPEATAGGKLMYHTLRAELEAAADCYGKEIESRQPAVVLTASAVFLKSLRASPRWPQLAKMMNLPIQPDSLAR